MGIATSTLITKIKAHEIPKEKLYAAIFVGLSDRSIALTDYTWLLGELYRYAEPISGRLATDTLFRYLYALPRGTTADEAISYAKKTRMGASCGICQKLPHYRKRNRLPITLPPS